MDSVDAQQGWNLVFTQSISGSNNALDIPTFFYNPAVIVLVKLPNLAWKRGGYLIRLPPTQFTNTSAESKFVRANQNQLIQFAYGIDPYYRLRFKPYLWIVDYIISIWSQ
jgi:hypothetical protein